VRRRRGPLPAVDERASARSCRRPGVRRDGAPGPPGRVSAQLSQPRSGGRVRSGIRSRPAPPERCGAWHAACSETRRNASVGSSVRLPGGEAMKRHVVPAAVVFTLTFLPAEAQSPRDSDVARLDSAALGVSADELETFADIFVAIEQTTFEYQMELAT